MASINKVILIANVGPLSGGLHRSVVQEALARYSQALDGYGRAFDDLQAIKFREAARRLAEALRRLRELTGAFATPKKIAADRPPVFNRTAAFFHAAKVDARNLP